jgi:hypothetical protein
MAVPDFQTLFRPLLEALGDGQEHRVSDGGFIPGTWALRQSLPLAAQPPRTCCAATGESSATTPSR